MAKPWAKYEVDFLRHAKFLALNSNAICLWIEAKNYCDSHQTDGRFPQKALKTFRFNGYKSVELLTRSCGLKPNNEPYAPLWEAQDIGGVTYYVMHDYLDHNDCRDEVLQRLQDADDKAALRRLANTERQRKARADRKAELAAKQADLSRARSSDSHRDSHSDSARDCHALSHPCAQVSYGPSESVSESVSLSVVQSTPRKPARYVPPTARSARVVFDGQKLVVFEWMLDDCCKTLGTLIDAFDLHAWFYQLDAEALATHLVIPKRDGGAWLQAQLIAEATRRGLPLQVAAAPEAPGRGNKRIAALAAGGEAFLRRQQRG